MVVNSLSTLFSARVTDIMKSLLAKSELLAVKRIWLKYHPAKKLHNKNFTLLRKLGFSWEVIGWSWALSHAIAFTRHFSPSCRHHCWKTLAIAFSDDHHLWSGLQAHHTHAKKNVAACPQGGRKSKRDWAMGVVGRLQKASAVRRNRVGAHSRHSRLPNSCLLSFSPVVSGLYVVDIG